MRCPWCELDDRPRVLHAHLASEHLERVEVIDDGEGKRYYRITCPECGSAYEQRIKPRLHDPSFIEEFRREIALVGFDMLINHLLAEHAPQDATARGNEEEAE